MPPKNRSNKGKLLFKRPSTSSTNRTKKACTESSAPRGICDGCATDDDSYNTPPCSERMKISSKHKYVRNLFPHIQSSQREINAARYDGQFGEIISQMIELTPTCKKIKFDDVLPLACLLVEEGCREGSGLWIALKFASARELTPGASLMAAACKLQKRTLIAYEAEDLKMLNWDIAPLARRCKLLA